MREGKLPSPNWIMRSGRVLWEQFSFVLMLSFKKMILKWLICKFFLIYSNSKVKSSMFSFIQYVDGMYFTAVTGLFKYHVVA